MNENKYKFTIITVCYNAEETIGRTIQSLMMQTYKNYEYIIKDGCSTDGTVRAVYSCLNESDSIHIISAADAGIYDAMNQALNTARGEYVYFLNAGDVFYDPEVLEHIAQVITQNENDIVYGDIVWSDNGRLNGRKYSGICARKIYALSGDCICHQAMFAKRILFDKKAFDTSFRVCADKEWQLYQICAGTSFYHADRIIAEVLVSGFSTEHLREFETETSRCVHEYCPKEEWIYKIVVFMKNNKLLLGFCRTIEKAFFMK
ncbi:MAG: glycosyltransferase [Butyrivibrio sp.]|nr:glycosyltransferase [Butyrivibrio sp.]